MNTLPWGQWIGEASYLRQQCEFKTLWFFWHTYVDALHFFFQQLPEQRMRVTSEVYCETKWQGKTITWPSILWVHSEFLYASCFKSRRVQREGRGMGGRSNLETRKRIIVVVCYVVESKLKHCKSSYNHCGNEGKKKLRIIYNEITMEITKYHASEACW